MKLRASDKLIIKHYFKKNLAGKKELSDGSFSETVVARFVQNATVAQERAWAEVVRLTLSNYENTEKYKLIIKRFAKCEKEATIYTDLYIDRSTYYLWQHEIYEFAFILAVTKGLLHVDRQKTETRAVFEAQTPSKGGLQQMIDAAADSDYIRLEHDYELKVDGGKIVLGWKKCQRALKIDRESLVLDGGYRTLKLVLSGALTEDVTLIEITRRCKHAVIRNLVIEIEYHGPSTGRTLYAIKNAAKCFNLVGCRMKMTCSNQINMTAVMNEGATDTTLESGADELSVADNRIVMQSFAMDYVYAQTLIGISNALGNSAVLTNNYVSVQTRGDGERQRALGIFNSGRYARIHNNNVKANGNHNVGKQLENAHATGLENRGDCMLLSDNNIVGEWGGQCLGVVNYGAHVKIDGNKILSTHTIKGCSVRQCGMKGVVTNNIVTSTSRNPRLVEIVGDDNLVQGNMIDALMRNACYSGCGIVLGSDGLAAKRVQVRGNLIRGAVDAGVYLKSCSDCAVTDNRIDGVEEHRLFCAVLGKQMNGVVERNQTGVGFDHDESAAAAALDDDKIMSVYD